MYVYGTFIRCSRPLIQNGSQLVAHHDPAEGPHEDLQNIALDGRQLHGLAGAPEFARKRVELEATHLDDLRLGEIGVARAAQDCPNARE